MKLSLKVSVAIHVLLVIYFFEKSIRITGNFLTMSTGCNPVVVRSIVKALKLAGMLKVARGPKSATCLLKAPGEISLWDIHEAVDPASLEKMALSVHNKSSMVCPVGRHISELIRTTYQKITDVIEKEMRNITLNELIDIFSLDEIEAHKLLIERAIIAKTSGIWPL
jgi:DNA-binding IscR family transcriptional regulator